MKLGYHVSFIAPDTVLVAEQYQESMKTDLLYAFPGDAEVQIEIHAHVKWRNE